MPLKHCVSGPYITKPIHDMEFLRHSVERQAQEALVLRAKQEWERTVDAMPDMIAIVDKEHNIVWMNKTMRSSYEGVFTSGQ